MRLSKPMFLGMALAIGLAGQAGRASACEPDREHGGTWLAGDFHQHTLYTDGSTSFDYVMSRDNMFGLDWWANSEHGGSRVWDGNGVYWDNTAVHPAGTIKGDVAMSGGHQLMYRWQSLREFVWPDIVRSRGVYPQKRILSGLEWNVPGHEHCSTGIVARDASAISAFEFMFDATDHDTSRSGELTPYGVLTKQNGMVYSAPGSYVGKAYPNRHTDSVAACAWMQSQMDQGKIDNGWIVFAHVERAGSWTPTKGGGYNVEHFRDLNNAGPDVCFGFEGAPGHQVESFRGFGNTVTCDAAGGCTSKDFGGAYGGVGYYTARVGGLWDALLGEGRHWFNFASSDYHEHWTRGSSDFYPGEYQKDWVFVKNTDPARFSYNEIADALRSGNSWFVEGDLIDHLEFTASQNHIQAGMGGTLSARTSGKRTGPVIITIKYRSPAFNSNGAKPAVDHIDLIAGNVTGIIDPSSPDYTKPTNDSTRVIASYKASDFAADAEGFRTVQVQVDVPRPMYFRLRGTNLPCGTANETGPATALPSADYCSPLPDALAGTNTAAKAFNDLWFYSNPIFVYVK
jgi:hypothetical protein